MNKCFPIFLSAILFCLSLSAQWLPVDSGTSLWLRGVSFASPSTGLVVGYDGLILRTDNFGDSWTEIASGTDKDLLSVFFVNEEVAYVTGALGIVLKTIDGGLSWKIVKDGGAVTHESFFLSPDLGYITGEGGQIFKTNNGGLTWELLPVGIAGKVAVHFTDEETGYFVGLGNEDAIIKTTDGGLSFTAQNTFGFEEYSSIFFTSQQTGYVVNIGGQRIIKTNDGGNSWSNLLTNADAKLYDITFYNENFGQVVGGFPNKSVILRTQDAGQLWQQENSGTDQPLFDSEMITAEFGFAVGMNGTILRRSTFVPVTEVLQPNDFQLYPNPTSDALHIEADKRQNIQFTLSTIHGITLQTGILNYEKTLDMGSLASGIYLLKLEDGHNSLAFKVQKL